MLAGDVEASSWRHLFPDISFLHIVSRAPSRFDRQSARATPLLDPRHRRFGPFSRSSSAGIGDAQTPARRAPMTGRVLAHRSVQAASAAPANSSWLSRESWIPWRRSVNDQSVCTGVSQSFRAPFIMPRLSTTAGCRIAGLGPAASVFRYRTVSILCDAQRPPTTGFGREHCSIAALPATAQAGPASRWHGGSLAATQFMGGSCAIFVNWTNGPA